MHCSYSGAFNKCNSGKKRCVIGQKRDDCLNKIVKQNMSAVFVRKTEANLLMEFGESEPSHLPSLNALRELKYRNNKKNQLHNDPTMALHFMKSIHRITKL